MLKGALFINVETTTMNLLLASLMVLQATSATVTVPENVNCAALSRDGRFLVVGDAEGNVNVFSLFPEPTQDEPRPILDVKLVKSKKVDANAVVMVDINRDASQVIVKTGKRYMERFIAKGIRWRLEDDDIIPIPNESDLFFDVFAFSPDGSKILGSLFRWAANADRSGAMSLVVPAIVDPLSGRILKTGEMQHQNGERITISGSPLCISVDPNGSWFTLGGDNKVATGVTGGGIPVIDSSSLAWNMFLNPVWRGAHCSSFDGKKIFFWSGNKEIHELSLASFQSRKLVDVKMGRGSEGSALGILGKDEFLGCSDIEIKDNGSMDRHVNIYKMSDMSIVKQFVSYSAAFSQSGIVATWKYKKNEVVIQDLRDLLAK